MKKKLLTIFASICMVGGCLALVACKNGTQIDKYEDDGYKVFVTYDANGGKCLGREGVSVMDMFNPDNYQADENNKVHIKLMEPTDASRPSTSEPISYTKTGYFFAGWYQTRYECKNDDGKVIDDNNNVLTQLEDGSYVLEGTTTISYPAYTYGDYWDFEEDRVEYTLSSERLEMTLYAGWVRYYEFNYLAQNAQGEWESIGTSDFDYKEVNKEGSTNADGDTIWLPDWKNGKMEHTHAYTNSSLYTFPSVEGKTFDKAYLDAECQEEIPQSFVHQGTLDLEKGVAQNRVQNIYVKFVEGERYKIQTAEQLIEYASPAGYYEILSDLDFTDKTWPSDFSTANFTGKMYGANGENKKISNVTFEYNSTDLSAGGLFGYVDKTAVLSNLTFDTVVIKFSSINARAQEGYYGAFAGWIEEEATVEDIVLKNVSLAIGNISWKDEYSFHLTANGTLDGIEVENKTALSIVGENLYVYYLFTIDYKTVSVNAEGFISLTAKDTEDYEMEQLEFIINY